MEGTTLYGSDDSDSDSESDDDDDDGAGTRRTNGGTGSKTLEELLASCLDETFYPQLNLTRRR